MSDASSTSPDSPTGVDLDPEQLSPGALRGLVEEYVTREGTDYGSGSSSGASVTSSEWTLEEKVAQVLRQIDRGDARIVFDLETESASVVTEPELALHILEASGRAPT